MSDDEAKRVIVELFEAFGEGRWDDPAHVLKNMSDDAEWWVAGTTRISGTLTKKQMMRSLRDGCRNGQRRIEDHADSMDL